jgi:uncharacterized membrane protein YhaH (DUF805 family)
MNPFQWAVLPFKRYVDFAGRSPRAEYWWYVLTLGIAGFLLGLADVVFLGGPVYGNYGPLGLLFTVGCLVPGFAVLVRRLHDTGRSGWWALVRLPALAVLFSGVSALKAITMLKSVPTLVQIGVGGTYVVVAFIVFLFTIAEGEGAPNLYGPDPYGEDHLEQVFA